MAPSKAPFPWFGGKSLAAELIWSRLGADSRNYVEPFFGSGAVWLNRPAEYAGLSAFNDLDCNIANVWRAMRADSLAVAEHACAPVNECDLHARHLWLVTNLPKLAPRLMADPDYYDARAAGWWIWGACSWIGSGWCSGEGPWSAVPDDDGIPALARCNAGQGVNRKLPHLSNAGQGVNRQLPYLSKAGRGVNRKLPQGTGGRLEWLQAWFSELSASLADTRVACGDWSRLMSVGTMTRPGICAVLLDPPYSQTKAVYAHDSSSVAHDVRAWCVANGRNPKLRIALCGHDGEHNELEGLGWSAETWVKAGGYQGADDRERIWFSPHCVRQAAASSPPADPRQVVAFV